MSVAAEDLAEPHTRRPWWPWLGVAAVLISAPCLHRCTTQVLRGAGLTRAASGFAGLRTVTGSVRDPAGTDAARGEDAATGWLHRSRLPAESARLRAPD